MQKKKRKSKNIIIEFIEKKNDKMNFRKEIGKYFFLSV